MLNSNPAVKIMDHSLLDARGMKCPLPVLKARKIFKTLLPGEELTILTDDPGAPGDFQHFCEVTGYILVNEQEQEGGHCFLIRKT